MIMKYNPRVGTNRDSFVHAFKPVF